MSDGTRAGAGCRCASPVTNGRREGSRDGPRQICRGKLLGRQAGGLRYGREAGQAPTNMPGLKDCAAGGRVQGEGGKGSARGRIERQPGAAVVPRSETAGLKDCAMGEGFRARAGKVRREGAPNDSRGRLWSPDLKRGG